MALAALPAGKPGAGSQGRIHQSATVVSRQAHLVVANCLLLLRPGHRHRAGLLVVAQGEVQLHKGCPHAIHSLQVLQHHRCSSRVLRLLRKLYGCRQ